MSSGNVGSANLLVQATLDTLLANFPNRRDGKARTDRLLAAALLECAEKGYTNTTVAGIAKRARVSTASVYATYADRDALLVAAMELLFTIMAGDVIAVPENDDPLVRVEQLLLAHGAVYTQPLTAWLCRLHATLAWSGHRHLHGLGLEVFQGIDGFWRAFLSDLVAQGHLRPLDLDTVVPLLLGPVERCTIIAALGCGEGSSAPGLAAVARHSAQTLFRLWGPEVSAPFAPGVWAAADALVAHMAPAPPSPAERLDIELSRQPLRQTPQGQKDRIVLAAAVAGASQSYSAISVQALATLARVSTATIYKHHRDKADLFTHALETEFAGQAAVEPPQQDLPGEQDGVARTIFAIATEALRPDWAWMHNVMMVSELSGSGRVAAVARQHRRAAEARVEAVLAQHLGPPVLAPEHTALLVNFLLGAVERSGVLALILFGEGEVDVRKLALLANLAAATVNDQTPILEIA